MQFSWRRLPIKSFRKFYEGENKCKSVVRSLSQRVSTEFREHNPDMSRITLDTLNSHAKAAEYAVRGAIVSRSAELAAQLKDDPNSLPFNQIISCNIGNPQALAQKPISFVRDVVSCVVNDRLLESDMIPEDAKARARKYLDCGSSMGAYTESKGLIAVREEVAEFLHRRDGFPANTDSIYLTNGASAGVGLVMQTVMRDPASGVQDGIMAPIPQYPIYSALSTLLNGELVPYYLDEENAWACSEEAILSAMEHAEEHGITLRGLVVINPGNPTGQVLARGDMENIIKICRERGVAIMADEVYQENVYREGSEFHSFRKVAFEMDAFSGDNPLQLASFHSTSKGFLGECGFRGGYFELNGFPQEVNDVLYKMASLGLCANTVGQVITGAMVNPPQSGDVSFDQYMGEKTAILDSMKRRAAKLSAALNELEGVTCNSADGAMYAFPRIRLGAEAASEAQKQGMAPDAFYCMELLNHTGVVVVPGSGFGQAPGTMHFRTTILPPESQLDSVIASLGDFHANFLAKYPL